LFIAELGACVYVYCLQAAIQITTADSKTVQDLEKANLLTYIHLLAT